MKEDKISHTQLTALIWAGVLAPAAELLPTITLPGAGKGAWLAPAAAIPLVLLSGWLLGTLAGRTGLAGTIRSILGPVGGGGLLLIYIVWAEVLLSLRLRLCAQRLLSSGYRDGELWFFLLAVAALALWVGVGKLSAFARAGQFFLVILLTAAGIVLALSLFQVRPERVLPLWTGDTVPVLYSALPAGGALGWGLWGAFLTGQVGPSKQPRGWHWLFWGMGGCLLLALAQFIILGSLGPALSARLTDPFFALAKSVGVEGAFQRVESVISALWTLADLSTAALLLFAIRAMGGIFAPKAGGKTGAAVALVLAAVLALGAFPDGMAGRWGRELVPAVNLLLGLGAPILLFLLRGLCEKRQRRGISCGEKR